MTARSPSAAARWRSQAHIPAFVSRQPSAEPRRRLSTFLSRTMSVSRGHAPAQHRAALAPLEPEVLDQEPDQDDGHEAREDEVGVHLEAVLIDEPAEAALAARHPEDHLGGNDGAPGEGPADLDARQDLRECGRE